MQTKTTIKTATQKFAMIEGEYATNEKDSRRN